MDTNSFLGFFYSNFFNFYKQTSLELLGAKFSLEISMGFWIFISVC